MNSFLRVFVLSTIFSLVVGHTYFSALVIGGTELNEGDCVRPHPGSKYDYPISSIDNPTGIQSNNMTCGFLPKAAQAANRKCPISAGSTVGIQWHFEMGEGASDTFIIDPSHHGPCMVYLAKSETGSGPVWFKIFEDGYNTTSKTWCVDRLKLNKGVFNFVIPSDLSPGNYLLRGELIALHEGDQLGGAQFYVHCAEITISGSGNSNPTSTYLTSIPGVYTINDPGIHFDIYDGFKTYPIPGSKLYVSSAISSGGNNVPVTTGRNSPITSGVQSRSTTGGNTRITSGSHSRSTTGSSQQTVATTGSTPTPTPTPTPNPITSGVAPDTCTGHQMKCYDDTHFQSCFNGVFAAPQSCQSGLVCKQGSTGVYCVRPGETIKEVNSGISSYPSLIFVMLAIFVSFFAKRF